MSNSIIHLRETDSTNSYLSRLLPTTDMLGHGAIVVADFQTDGRGQMNNHWESERGKNLLFSMLLLPKGLKASTQFPLSEAVALGICDVLDKEAEGFKVKWPNDIYWKDKKIAGILIENFLAGDCVGECIAGIGLNINQTEFKSDAPNPVSLSTITGKNYDTGTILSDLQKHILSRFSQAMNDAAGLHKDYKNKLYRFGDFFPFEDSEGKFSGRITDVEPCGHIIIEKENGPLSCYAFKEVSFVL